MTVFNYVKNVDEILKKWEENPMLSPRIAKVTVNVGVGALTERIPRIAKVLEEITGQKPVPRKAKRTIKDFGIRKGENIGVAVTLRKEKAVEFLKKALAAVGYRLKAASFDDYGNASFGVKEHILIPGVKYDPEIGIFGMDVCITLERPGFRVLRRRYRKARSIPRRHRVTREEAMTYLYKFFNIEII